MFFWKWVLIWGHFHPFNTNLVCRWWGMLPSFQTWKNTKKPGEQRKLKRIKIWKQLKNEKNRKFIKKKLSLPGVYLLQPENIEWATQEFLKIYATQILLIFTKGQKFEQNWIFVKCSKYYLARFAMNGGQVQEPAECAT